MRRLWRFAPKAVRQSLLLTLLAVPNSALADDTIHAPPRSASLTWDGVNHSYLYATVSYRDVVNADIKAKLTRGLPTTIVFTANLSRVGSDVPAASTVQSCRITWHVWEEAYRLEIIRAGASTSLTWTTTTEGVLRRCAEARRLLVATRDQVPVGVPLVLHVRVDVNPIGDDLLQKIKRWVSRPAGSGSSAPGDALFGTFTGFFMQRIGEAERVLIFTTRPAVPTVASQSSKSSP